MNVPSRTKHHSEQMNPASIGDIWNFAASPGMTAMSVLMAM